MCPHNKSLRNQDTGAHSQKEDPPAASAVRGPFQEGWGRGGQCIGDTVWQGLADTQVMPRYKARSVLFRNRQLSNVKAILFIVSKVN